ncbi:MAG: hypothetical protein EXX96DRAFT_653899 [Benjaminiella poitrasii]|nr:MAG: hypothetical protein EXX96DRAFT_653899 [Benjaminiella poitrasii]
MSNTIDFSKLKVVELRSELSKRNLPTKGRKDELVARLNEAVEAEKKDNQQQVAMEKLDDQNNEEPKENEEETNDQTSAAADESQLVEEDAKTVKEQESANELSKEKSKKLEEASFEETQKQKEETNDVSRNSDKEDNVEPKQETISDASKKTPAIGETQQTEGEVSEKIDEKIVEKASEEAVEKPTEGGIENKPQENQIEKLVNETKEPEMMDQDSDANNKRKRSADELDDEKRMKIKTGDLNNAIDSSALYVKGFIRPLIIRHVQELFSKYGEVKRFWMDAIKTHCYVIYEKESEAAEAFKNVNGLTFPVETGRKLTVGSLSNEQIEKLIDIEQNAAEQRLKIDWESNIEKLKAGESLPKSPATEGHRKHRSIGIDQVARQLAQASSEPTPQVREVRVEPPRQKQKELSLDDLFRKTQTLPHLYYLPNTDEEAKVNLEKLQKLA